MKWKRGFRENSWPVNLWPKKTGLLPVLTWFKRRGRDLSPGSASQLRDSDALVMSLRIPFLCPHTAIRGVCVCVYVCVCVFVMVRLPSSVSLTTCTINPLLDAFNLSLAFFLFGCSVEILHMAEDDISADILSLPKICWIVCWLWLRGNPTYYNKPDLLLGFKANPVRGFPAVSEPSLSRLLAPHQDEIQVCELGFGL